PGKLTVGELHFALVGWSRSVRSKRLERYLRDVPISRDLYKPGVDYILAPGIVVIQLDGVVVHITCVVDRQRTGDEGVPINVGAEGIEACNDRAISPVQLEHGSSEPGIVHKISGQRAVVYRLPARAAERHGFPIALEIPDLG